MYIIGTGGNSLVDVFNRIIERRKCQLNYIIPISDNGGSSSELIRFIGGPSKFPTRRRNTSQTGTDTSNTGVGDVRSENPFSTPANGARPSGHANREPSPPLPKAALSG